MLFHELIKDKVEELQEKYVKCTQKAIYSLMSQGVLPEHIHVFKSTEGETRILGNIGGVYYGYKISAVFEEEKVSVIATPYSPHE